MKKHNFSAGPSILANEVITQAAKSVKEINDFGLSILEISHRSNQFVDIMNTAQKLVKDLLNISDDYAVLFLQGGASLQFYMSSLNFLKPNGKAGYIDTGTWSQKAIQEAKKNGDTVIVASSKEKNYSFIPKNIKLKEKIDYLHFTSNNTIYGTQFHDFNHIVDLAKKNGIKLICDMSSDIFSKKINVSQFDMIYAGAQKNIGPAGTTIVIIKKDSLKLDKKVIPTYLNYQTHIDKKSMFNTPPVFSIYVSMLTLKWIKENGGIDSIEKNNIEKASKMYQEIDRNPLFYGLVDDDDRSNMNATFKLKDEDNSETFDQLCEKNGIYGIKGHRSVGGYRASMYNALGIESIQALINIMQKMEKK